MPKTVVVIGGGLAGLSAALRLARSGFKVELFEKNASLGGKMNEQQVKGYRFDTGPSLLTMPFVIDELFHMLGINRESRLQFEEIDPVCSYFWDDGSSLQASMNYSKMRRQMSRFSERDADRYRDFLEYSRAIYELTADVFLFSPLHEKKTILNRHTLKKLMKIKRIDPLRTVHEGIRRFFGDPRLAQIFDRYATYNGSDPYQAPATLNVIPYVEYVLGSFYIKGGMYRLVEVLTEVAAELGVTIHTSAPVDKIEHTKGSVTGITVNGSFKAADYVLCNADVVSAFNHLIDGFPAKKAKLNRLEPSLSGLVFLWGVNRKHDQLSHHNILFSNDYKLEFEQMFNRQQLPDEPTVYISISSKSDPHHAPDGKENWFVLVNTPYLNDSQDWPELTDKVRAIVLKRLQKINIDIRDTIETEQVLTPQDFFNLYGSNRGSIYGISSNSRTTAFRRPANRSRQLRGLYFAGGSSHPGGGIPLVLLSGKIAADLISENEDTTT